MEKLTKPIIIGAIIIGVSVIGSQYLKQSSIEKQQRLEIQAEQEKELNAKIEKEQKENSLNLCIRFAEDAYWQYMRLNGKEKGDGLITAPQYIWDNAEEEKQNEIDNCYKQYK